MGGEKKDAYLTIPSLSAYLLIETDRPRLVMHRRTETLFVAHCERNYLPPRHVLFLQRHAYSQATDQDPVGFRAERSAGGGGAGAAGVRRAAAAGECSAGAGEAGADSRCDGAGA